MKRPLPLLAGLLVAAYLALAWFELVPGGWRLRNLFEPWPERRARRELEHREERLEQFRAEQHGSRPVVFLGSSTIERFPLAEVFPGISALNRGVAFEDSRRLLERLEVGVPGDAVGFVLYVASIDHRFTDATAGEVAGALRRVVEALRTRHPEAPVAVLGLLPERELGASARERLEAANAALAQASVELGAVFVPTDRPPLADPEGHLELTLSTDELHLSPAGYSVLGGWLRSESGALGALLRSDR